MPSPQQTATGAPAEDRAPIEPVVRELLLRLGIAMMAAGDATASVQRSLLRVATAYGVPDARVSVLPTAIFVGSGPHGAANLITVPPPGVDSRLDRVEALYDITRRAEQGSIAPADAIRELDALGAMPPRAGVLRLVLGHAVLTAGLCLVLQPSVPELALATALGVVVGALKLAGQRSSTASLLVPIAAAILVSGLAFTIAPHDTAASSMRVLIPPLITFLPGSLLTMATIDLAAGETVSGASRLVAGMLRLLLLAFGILIGALSAGLPPVAAADPPPVETMASWAPWLGVVVYGVGAWLHTSAARDALPWILLVLAAAWLGEVAGREVLDAQLTGFFGALAMLPVARFVERRRTGPPSMVTFLPGFWLLVPGSLGLIGVTEFVGGDQLAGLDVFVNALISIVAIALGILVASAIRHGLEELTGWRDARRARAAAPGPGAR